MRMARPQIGGLLEGDWERLGTNRSDQQQQRHETRAAKEWARAAK